MGFEINNHYNATNPIFKYFFLLLLRVGEGFGGRGRGEMRVMGTMGG